MSRALLWHIDPSISIDPSGSKDDAFNSVYRRPGRALVTKCNRGKMPKPPIKLAWLGLCFGNESAGSNCLRALRPNRVRSRRGGREGARNVALLLVWLL